MLYRNYLSVFLTCLLAIGTTISFLGCGARENDLPQATNENLAFALKQAVDNSILPAVEGFSTASTDLQNQSVILCESINESNLYALQQQWRSTYEAWFRLANYNFGPLNDDLVFPKYTFIDSYRFGGTNYTDTVRNAILNNLASDATLDSDFFNSQGFQKVGLLALELVVFETATAEHSTTLSDIVDEYQNQPRKCQLLLGLSQHLNAQATYVKQGWTVQAKNSTNNYRTLLVTDQLDDGTAAITKLLTSVQEYLDYLKKRNVATTVAPVSGHAWQALAVALDEVNQLLEGTSETSVSFFQIMEAGGLQNAVESIRAKLLEAENSIEAQDSEMLGVALGQLDGYFKWEIPQGLNVDLGISFSDGD